MEKDILDGKIGTVGAYDLEFKGGVLSLAVGVEKIGKVSLKIEVPAAAVIDAISAAVPGKIDDAILGVLKAALLSQ